MQEENSEGEESKDLRDALEQKKSEWEAEQQRLKTLLREVDDDGAVDPSSWSLFGGVDISFVKGTNTACASLVVLQGSEVLYKDFALVEMDEPYIAGYLAFREVKHLEQLWKRLEERIERKEATIQRLPDVVIVDGNGVLHPQGFGLASHLGVVLNCRTIGCAKTFLQVDGLTKYKMLAELAATKRHESGFTSCRLFGDSGKCHGTAVLSHLNITKPMFISVGHRVSLETALLVIQSCCKYRLPESIRAADQLSRAWLREKAAEIVTENRGS